LLAIVVLGFNNTYCCLQDTQDLVILEALFACWLASHDRQWQLDDVRAMAVSTRTWIDEVVLPLRATRRDGRRCRPE
jgi:hypothetical protein